MKDETNCLNSQAVHFFSMTLADVVRRSVTSGYFPAVLGGDCSILIGITAALKQQGNYGIVFFDAHADFYLPHQSPTGEVADMELAIVTGRGPEALSNLFSQGPYVADENVIHIGQRDWDETKRYGSEDIRETAMKCLSNDEIKLLGKDRVIDQLLVWVNILGVDGFWMHLDADVLSDEVNPAVDYRIPGGMTFDVLEEILGSLLASGKMVGLSVTILNPKLDKNGSIAGGLTDCLGAAFRSLR
jgi:arginase